MINSNTALLQKIGIIIAFLLLFANSFFLDLKVLSGNSISEKKIKEPASVLTTIKEENSCPMSCLSIINLATSSLQSAQPKVTSSAKETQVKTVSGVKEFFVPLGSGSNSTDDWADVSGAQAYVDSTSYSHIKNVTFESSVHILTGNETAYVRLFNQTDKHPVWYSDVFLSGGTPQLLTSQPITLDSGNKLYQVQMKTSLKFQAILDLARIHITIY